MNQRAELVESFFVALPNDESFSPCTAVLLKCEESCSVVYTEFHASSCSESLVSGLTSLS